MEFTFLNPVFLLKKYPDPYELFAVTTTSSEIKTSEAKSGKKEKKETAKEAAQDLLLVITLEVVEMINNKPQMRVLARKSLDVWPKEAINKRDLDKPERM